MKYCVLCGGMGTRLQNDTTFPKPLTHVLGVPLIEHVLKSIPSEDDLVIILNKDLRDYNFDTVVHHLSKKNIQCVYLDRHTRGAVETAFLGISKLGLSPNEPVCFFDNDTVYKLDDTSLPDKTFICYSRLEDDTKYHPYSFITKDGDSLTSIAEKVQISDMYACGIYGFRSASLFLEKARSLLLSDHSNELYMSMLYSSLLKDGEDIDCIELARGACLGTPEEVSQNVGAVPWRKLRICFDLDNTLIKYRLPGQSYAECDGITRMAFLARKLKELGHTIIIHTARGMKTANGNLGKAMRNIAEETFTSLEKNNIPYDEIYFGKPDADLYIDDKAFNPYLNTFQSIGFEHLTQETTNSTNKFNTIQKNKDVVIKTGPLGSMRGEVHFYQAVKGTELETHFPRFIKSRQVGSSTKMYLEYINGFTFYELLRDGLLTNRHVQGILESLDTIHTHTAPIIVTKDDIYENYMGKLKKRILNKTDYPFENTEEVIAKLDPYVNEYVYRETTRIVPFVHGDPWFSNTLLSKNKVIFLDMKGDINGTLTTNGDSLTDYCKILQSLLGFDSIVFGTEQPSDLPQFRSYYMTELEARGYTRQDVLAVTACLIAKTISFFDSECKFRNEIWNLVVQIVTEL
jgi:capsule biosynthesis phosphatase